jgi:hypothetical protein
LCDMNASVVARRTLRDLRGHCLQPHQLPE